MLINKKGQNSSNAPNYATLDPSYRSNNQYALQNNVLPPANGRQDYSSSYNNSYSKPPGKGATRVTRYDMINNNFILPNDRFKGESSYNGSYKNNMDSRVRSDKVSYPDHEVLPRGDFQGNSSYLETYVNAKGMRSNVVKHEPEIVLGTEKHDSVSSYNAEYNKKERVAANERVIAPPNFVLPNGNFAGSSTYDNTYVPGITKKTEIIKPPQGDLKVGGKFIGASSYNSDFDERNRVYSVREKAQFAQNEVLPKGNFKGDSTYQSNYLFNERPTPSKITKHQQELQVGGQFYGESSYASAHDNKGVAVRQKVAPIAGNQVLPEGKFQDFTTYTGHYVENPVQRTYLYKQEGELKVQGGIFKGGSSYDSDYAHKLGESRQRTISYPSNQVLPRGNFIGNSTYVQNYVPSKFQKRQQYIPKPSLQVGGKFQGNSNYSQTYDGGQSPAKYLSKLSEYDSNKHR